MITLKEIFKNYVLNFKLNMNFQQKNFHKSLTKNFKFQLKTMQFSFKSTNRDLTWFLQDYERLVVRVLCDVYCTNTSQLTSHIQLLIHNILFTSVTICCFSFFRTFFKNFDFNLNQNFIKLQISFENHCSHISSN